MVLTGRNIQQAVAGGAIRVAPFDRGQINPVSYDLRLDDLLISASGKRVQLPPQGRTLRKGEFWIGRSIEHVSFPTGEFFATLHNKSGTARQGATAHLTANIIQPEHQGPVSFYIDVAEDVHVIPGMRYAQMKPMSLDDFVAGRELAEAVERGDITITPFNLEQIRGVSYRLRLSETLRSVRGEAVVIPPEGIAVRKGDFWIGESIEHVAFSAPGVMASLHNKSRTASYGMTAHMCAGIIQPDHAGPVRFHIRATNDCILYPGMEFAQLTFPQTRSAARPDAGVMLDHTAIEAAISAGTITVDPFVPEVIGLGNPATARNVGIDFHLGSELKACVGTDADGRQIFAPVEFPASGVIELNPGVLYLGHTLEEIGSTEYAMALHGLESMAAMSVEPQIDADLGHTGVRHRWTLEIRCAERAPVWPGMRIGQVLFEAVRGPVVQYEGKHGRFSGAQESLSHLEGPGR